jgi:hypothetical protein
MMNEHIPKDMVLMCLSLGVGSFIPLASAASINKYFIKPNTDRETIVEEVKSSKSNDDPITPTTTSLKEHNIFFQPNSPDSHQPVAECNEISIAHKKKMPTHGIEMFIQKKENVAQDYVSSPTGISTNQSIITEISEPTFLCSECSAQILIRDKQLHADHHFAVNLQLQMRTEDRARREVELQSDQFSRKNATSASSKKSSRPKGPANSTSSNTLLSMWSKPNPKS